MRLLIFLDHLLQGFRHIAPIEPRPLDGRFLVLEIAEQVQHELLAVMHHDGVELFGNQVFQGSRVKDRVFNLEHVLVEKVEAVAKTEVVPGRPDVFELGILLEEEMIPQVINRN